MSNTPFSEGYRLKDIQRRVQAVRKERGFSMDPLHILANLTEEVGEVAKALKPSWSENYGVFSPKDLADELADVMIGAIALANRYEIDMESALDTKFFQEDAARSWHSAKVSPNEDHE